MNEFSIPCSAFTDESWDAFLIGQWSTQARLTGEQCTGTFCCRIETMCEFLRTIDRFVIVRIAFRRRQLNGTFNRCEFQTHLHETQRDRIRRDIAIEKRNLQPNDDDERLPMFTHSTSWTFRREHVTVQIVDFDHVIFAVLTNLHRLVVGFIFPNSRKERIDRSTPKFVFVRTCSTSVERSDRIARCSSVLEGEHFSRRSI